MTDFPEDYRPSEREQWEARILANLLGEANAAEQKAIAEKLKQDPTLQEFREDMAALLPLAKAAADYPKTAPEKLSADRRSALETAFANERQSPGAPQTAEPPEARRPIVPNRWFGLLAAGMAAASFALLFGVGLWMLQQGGSDFSTGNTMVAENEVLPANFEATEEALFARNKQELDLAGGVGDFDSYLPPQSQPMPMPTQTSSRSAVAVEPAPPSGGMTRGFATQPMPELQESLAQSAPEIQRETTLGDVQRQWQRPATPTDDAEAMNARVADAFAPPAPRARSMNSSSSVARQEAPDDESEQAAIRELSDVGWRDADKIAGGTSDWAFNSPVAGRKDRRIEKKARLPFEPNPEVPAAEHPVSSFSLNVSDVSFQLAKAALAQGLMPDPASIRSEEFLNGQTYEQPFPLNNGDVALNFETARTPYEHNRTLLRLSVKALGSGRVSTQPLQITLLLDNSGSMERSDRKATLARAKEALGKGLQPNDRVNVITFAETPRLVAQNATPKAYAAQLERLNNLQPEGGTNLEAALDLAFTTTRQNRFANTSQNRVVLFTDGAANLGDIVPETLAARISSEREQGVAFDAFGIGWEEYDDSLLETLTRNGDGRYGFLNKPEDVGANFTEKLIGTFRPAAKDVKVQVEFNPRRVNVYRQFGYTLHQMTAEQFLDNAVDAAEIATNESGHALYSIEVKPEGDGPIGLVRIRYRDPASQQVAQVEWVLPYSAETPPLEDSSLTMRQAAVATYFAERLAGHPAAANVDFSSLQKTLEPVLATLPGNRNAQDLAVMLQQANWQNK